MPVQALPVLPSELNCCFVRPEGEAAAGSGCRTITMVSLLPGGCRWGGGYSRLLADCIPWCVGERAAAGGWPGGRGRAAVLMLLPMAQRCAGELAR